MILQFTAKQLVGFWDGFAGNKVVGRNAPNEDPLARFIEEMGGSVSYVEPDEIAYVASNGRQVERETTRQLEIFLDRIQSEVEPGGNVTAAAAKRMLEEARSQAYAEGAAQRAAA